MSAHTGVIAVQDADAATCGAVVYWTCSGSVPYAELATAWTAAGCDPLMLPQPPTPRVALHRALEAWCDEATSVRPLRGDRIGYVLVTEHYAKGDPRPTYTHGLEVEMDDAHALTVRGADAGDTRSVHASYQRHLGRLVAHDMSAWLCRLVRGVAAATLRDTGGIYFVPRVSMPQWRLYVAVLKVVSTYRVFELPAMTSAGAVEAVLDALAREAQETIDALTDDLIEGTFVQQRKVESRKERAALMDRKLTAYEGLLGGKLDIFRDKLATLQAQYASLVLSSEGDV